MSSTPGCAGAVQETAKCPPPGVTSVIVGALGAPVQVI